MGVWNGPVPMQGNLPVSLKIVGYINSNPEIHFPEIYLRDIFTHQQNSKKVFHQSIVPNGTKQKQPKVC